MKDLYSYEDDEPIYDEQDEVSAAPAAASVTVPQPSVLPNPVLKGFQTPAQPAGNTTPAPQPAVEPTQVPTAPAAAPATFQPPAAPPRSSQQQPASPVAAPAFQVPAPPPAIPPPAPAPVSLVYQPGVTASDPRYSPEYQQQQAEEQRAQYQRDRQASLRYLKGQGGRTKVLPTGEETEDTDEQGRQLYHPAILNPLERGEDGRAYRVSRDQLGQTQRFDLERDGAEGQDFHVDPQSGEKYVVLSGAEGGSKREVIGQDAYVPRIHALGTQLQEHSATSQQLDLAINQATHGYQGGTPLQAKSLQDLREEAATLTKSLKPLQGQLADMESYAPEGDSAADPADLTQKKQLQDQIRFKQNLLAPVQAEIDARDGTIADAQQQKDGIAGSRQQLTRQMGVLRAARYGKMNLQSDLGTVATGGMIDSNQMNVLAGAGLIVPEKNADGSILMRVSREAVGLMDADTQRQFKAAPERFNVMASATPQVKESVKAVQRQLPREEAPEAGQGNEEDDAPDFSPVDYQAIANQPQEQARVRRSWINTQRFLLARVPGIGVAGSPQNVAFVRAFRQSGGDIRRALQAVRMMSQPD